LPLQATRREWVLKPIIEFESTEDLLQLLPNEIVIPAEAHVEKVKLKKSERITIDMSHEGFLIS
jgi:hypothetical protein